MTRRRTSLRARLAILGLVGVITPLLVLFAVTAWTAEEVRTSSDGVTVTERDGVSPWIPATVGLLALPSALAAWWWAGREVASQERTAQAVDHERQLIEDTSHQLRTPIAVLITNVDVELADAESTNESLRAALQQSRRTAAGMQATVEGLLRQARARRDAANRPATDLVAIGAQVAQQHTAQAAAAGVAIRCSGPSRLHVPTDATALERAIDALVDNAVRHSPRGGSVRLDIDERDGVVAVSVTDDGPGIAAEHHADVYTRYWTTDPSRSGIGLAIVQEAARDAFDVQLESPTGPSGGCRFTLLLR